MRTWLQSTVAVVLASLVGVGSALVPTGARCSGAGVPTHACCCRAAAEAAAADERAAAASVASEPTPGGCCKRSAPTPARAHDPVPPDDPGCRCELRAPVAPMEGARLVLQAAPAVAVLVAGFAPPRPPVLFVPAGPEAHSHAPPASSPRAPRGPPLSSFDSIA